MEMVMVRYARAGYWVLLALGLYLSGRASALRSQEVSSSEMTLARDFQLSRLNNTNIWITSREARLRDDWQALPQHREAIAALDAALAERVEQNASQWATLEQRRAQLRTALAALSPADKQRRALEEQLKILDRQGIAPSRLSDQPDVRAKLVELTNHRHQLWLAARAIRRNTPELMREYEPLAASATVQAALGQLGSGHKLGPARDYVADLKKLPDWERIFLTDWIPLYQQGERTRLTLLAGMAEALGLEISSQAQTQMVTLAPQRTYAARQAVIPFARLGAAEVRELEVWVLPPEGEDLGARIGPAAFPNLRLQPQPERLRFLTSTGKQ
jgi:hypothetical protein